MSAFKTLSFLAVFALGAALSPAATAARLGQLPSLPANPDRGPQYGNWTATVRWYQPQVVNGVYYQWKYAHISANERSNCEYQLASYANSPGVQVIQFCENTP